MRCPRAGPATRVRKPCECDEWIGVLMKTSDARAEFSLMMPGLRLCRITGKHSREVGRIDHGIAIATFPPASLKVHVL